MSVQVTSSPYRHYFSARRQRGAHLQLPWSKKSGVVRASSFAQTAAIKRPSFKLKFQFGPSTIIIGLIVAVVALMFLYLAHFNRVATKGYDLKRLEADRQQLLGEYDVRNMKLADVRSMTSILQSEKVSRMRRPGNVIFVRGDTAIASRN